MHLPSPHTCYMLGPSNSFRFYHPNNNKRYPQKKKMFFKYTCRGNESKVSSRHFYPSTPDYLLSHNIQTCVRPGTHYPHVT
jgi:hypothetical protein